MCAVLLACPLVRFAGAENKSGRLEQYICSAFNARKSREGVSGRLLSSELFTAADKGGETAASSSYSDWMAFAMARYSVVYGSGTEYLYDEDYSAYLGALESYVKTNYEKNSGLLSASKPTEWHRCILALTALGGEPESFSEYCGGKINMIADSSYNSLVRPQRQGLNGVIFALISSNIKDFQKPSNAKYSDRSFIEYILSRQTADGGWAMLSSAADADISAMAIQALTPFYSSDTVYNISNVKTGEQQSLSVKQAVDRALSCLSAMQKGSGGFVSWGSENAESVAQVIIALTGLGIDIESDSRFIKNGSTLLDALLSYRLSDGSFTHSFSADAENPAAEPGEYSYMATDQAAMALVSYWRYINGLNPLYNLRPDSVNEQPLPQGLLQALEELMNRILQALRLFCDRLRYILVPNAQNGVVL